MRRVATILLSLMLGWIGGADVSAADLGVAYTHHAEIEAAGEAQWQCERLNNSDFGQTQSVAEVEPVRSTPVRTSSCPERMGIKCGMACDRTGQRVQCSPIFNTNTLLDGAYAVDLYVYRLRRLII